MNRHVSPKLQECLNAASNPDTPEAMLELLAYHPDWFVRALVAKNSNVPPKAIDYLLSDSHPVVREAARGVRS